MIPYFVLLGLPALFSLFKLKKDGVVKRSMLPLHLFFLIFLALLCLRHTSVGIDLKNYNVFFERVRAVDFFHIFSAYSEPGFHYLSKLTQIFHGDYQFLLALVAFVSVIPLWVMYKKESDNAYLTLILFATVAPFTMYFSGLRQILAMAFGVPAYYFTKKKKFFPFLFTVLVAVLFHQSALLLLILYPVYHLKISKNTAFLFAPAILFVLIFNRDIFKFLLRFLGDRYIERYSDMTSTGAYTVLLLLLVFLVYCYFIPDPKKLDADAAGLRNILLLCVGIQCFAPIHSIAMRMNYYFLIFIPILIPKIISAAKDSNIKLTKMSIVLMNMVFTAWFFWNAYTGADILNVFPYVPFWS